MANQQPVEMEVRDLIAAYEREAQDQTRRRITAEAQCLALGRRVQEQAEEILALREAAGVTKEPPADVAAEAAGKPTPPPRRARRAVKKAG